LPAKTNPASALAEAAITADSTPAPAEAPRASYRVLPKGAGLIYTGEFDPVTGASQTFEKGRVVEGVEPALAAELEDRGLVEVLGPA
jgi:hypothetical protein